MWKTLRITILLLILATVALNTWRGARAVRNWEGSTQIAVFPINGDGSQAAAQRIARLKPEDFRPIETFLAEQAHAWGHDNPRPVLVTLQSPLTDSPPAAPRNTGAFAAIVWSLKLRYWAWHQPEGRPRAQIRAFAIYHDSAANGGHLPDSQGLAKGLIALANLHSAREMQGPNLVVLTHEILHTMGATDKYGADLMPRYPEGYARPEATPRLPQQLCELMAGRIPVSAGEARIPDLLDECVIGPLSAREIGLRK